MNKFDFFNNYFDAVCILSNENEIIYKNNRFSTTFKDFISFDRFKKRFNFNLCFLSSDNFSNQTPIDLLLNSKENFHTFCTYQNSNGAYIYYYIYTFKYNSYKAVIFKDVTSTEDLETLNRQYSILRADFTNLRETQEQNTKLQELTQAQVLKMGIINRISLVIRETNDIQTILDCALKEINNLLGSFKTYFATKEKNYFKLRYSVSKNTQINTVLEFEEEVNTQIKNKNISANM